MMLTKIKRDSVSKCYFAKRQRLFQVDVVFDEKIGWQLTGMNFFPIVVNLQIPRIESFKSFKAAIAELNSIES